MKTKHVEDFSIACMDEGSIPSDSTIICSTTAYIKTTQVLLGGFFLRKDQLYNPFFKTHINYKFIIFFFGYIWHTNVVGHYVGSKLLLALMHQRFLEKLSEVDGVASIYSVFAMKSTKELGLT